MIKVDIDEASAFDMLAILHIKKGKGNEIASESYVSLARLIEDHLGAALFSRVLRSDTYMDLISANNLVFDYVDILNTGETKVISASDVHRANMARFSFKKLLQERFFTDPLTEQKI